MVVRIPPRPIITMTTWDTLTEPIIGSQALLNGRGLISLMGPSSLS